MEFMEWANSWAMFQDYSGNEKGRGDQHVLVFPAILIAQQDEFDFQSNGEMVHRCHPKIVLKSITLNLIKRNDICSELLIRGHNFAWRGPNKESKHPGSPLLIRLFCCPDVIHLHSLDPFWCSVWKTFNLLLLLSPDSIHVDLYMHLHEA